MLPFFTSLAAILVASPKARNALRNLAVEGTILSLDLKEQVERAAGIHKQVDESVNAEPSSTPERLTMPGSATSPNTTPMKDTPAGILQDLEHTHAILDTEALKRRLPKP